MTTTNNRPRLIFGGLAAGALINACEWSAHRLWLGSDWTSAFAALGKSPAGWASFIPANFVLGIVAVWLYRWLSGRYPAGFTTAWRTGLCVWVIFWVIPTLAMQPLALFPNRLLGLTILVGLADGVSATVLGAWIFEGFKWPPAALNTTGSFRHSGRRQGIQ